MNSEQWKLNGECEHCRRKNYCGTQCRLAEKREFSELSIKLFEAIDKARRKNNDN